MKIEIEREIKAIEEDLRNLNEFIYKNPELAFEEYKAAKGHIKLLKKHNFTIEEEFLGFKTAFKATYDSGKKGPTISYLSEYDALPEIGHGCGHNILGTTSTGAGIVLSKFIDEIGGKVVVLGTPAEETNGVKVNMVEAGVFEDIGVAMMVHPNATFLRSGYSLALSQIRIGFKGRSAHASTYPHEGINALDACLLTFNNINALREHIEPSARIHGIIKEGGIAVNVVPEYTEAHFAVRSPDTKYRDELVEKVINCAKAGALATGCEIEILDSPNSYSALITNEKLSEAYSKNLLTAGVKDLGERREGGGSLDMGNVSEVCPSIHPYFGIIPEDKEQYPTHTEEFSHETITEYAYENMKKTIEALVATGIDIIKDEELLKEIKEEFNRKVTE